MNEIRRKSVASLTTHEWALWSELQQAQPLLDSPYFRPEFARAVADVRRDVEIAVIEREGRAVGFLPFQRGKLHIGKPVAGKLSDYHGLIAPADLAIDPQQVIRQCGLAAWDFDHLVPQPGFDRFVTLREESPYLDLSQGYEAYCKGRRAAGSDVVAKTNQKARKCEREVGAMSFEYDCRDDEVLALLRTWKSAQYLRTGLPDVFAFDWTRRLLDRLRADESEALSAPLSVLRVAGKPACIALSLRSRGAIHCWFIAYDAELAQYSPGQTFFLRFAEAAAALGVHKIDLGKGDERYKWSLASGGLPVWEGTVGCPSLSLWMREGWRRTRDWVNNSALRETTKIPARLIQPVREWLAYH